MIRNIIIIFILIFCLTAIFICNRNGNDLKTNGILTNGQVVKAYWGRGGINLDYIFYVNGQKVDGSEFYFISIRFGNKFLHKSFPVIYSKNSIDRNRMLVLENDFKEFDMTYPDSLRWTLNYKSP